MGLAESNSSLPLFLWLKPGFHGPCGRVMETGHPSTRVVKTGHKSPPGLETSISSSPIAHIEYRTSLPFFQYLMSVQNVSVCIAKKLKKGMATAKQRLGKKLKIHKMIFWMSRWVNQCASYVFMDSYTLPVLYVNVMDTGMWLDEIVSCERTTAT